MFLVASKNHGVTKGGNSYLTLKLLDRSGEIEARVWERADDLGRGFDKNDFVRVRGQATLYQGKDADPRAGCHARRRVESRRRRIFCRRALSIRDAMLEELQTILRGIKNPHLLALAEACFADEELMRLVASRRPAPRRFIILI